MKNQNLNNPIQFFNGLSESSKTAFIDELKEYGFFKQIEIKKI